MTTGYTSSNVSLSELPSVDEVLAHAVLQQIASEAGRSFAVRAARTASDEIRRKLITSPDGATRENLIELIAETARGIWLKRSQTGVRRVINATGVIVHTNLGRSAIPPDAIAAIEKEASRYCTVEYDLRSGGRGRRGERAEELICELTGAESSVIVNNCAAAAFLVLKAVAAGKEVIISRGELVEIGGDFRIPDVLAESGATLREVGTTNRTKLRDYKAAITDNTGMILRVHPSNYRIVGFTEAPSLADLAALAAEHSIPLYEDAGSGAIADLAEFGLADEPMVARSLRDGAGIVTFSGDKLLGGPQAGFIVGRRELIDPIRKHPLYRALRVDKLTYAGIEATLEIYAREEHTEKIPTLKMLALTPEQILRRCEDLVAAAGLSAEGPQVEIVEGRSVVGGGSAPDMHPPTWLISVIVRGADAVSVEGKLRGRKIPVISRIKDDRVLLDLRTVFEDEDEEVAKAIAELVR